MSDESKIVTCPACGGVGVMSDDAGFKMGYVCPCCKGNKVIEVKA